MKLYSKSELVLCIACIVLELAYCTRGSILNVLFGVGFAGIGAAHLYRAFDRTALPSGFHIFSQPLLIALILAYRRSSA